MTEPSARAKKRAEKLVDEVFETANMDERDAIDFTLAGEALLVNAVARALDAEREVCARIADEVGERGSEIIATAIRALAEEE